MIWSDEKGAKSQLIYCNPCSVLIYTISGKAGIYNEKWKISYKSIKNAKIP